MPNGNSRNRQRGRRGGRNNRTNNDRAPLNLTNFNNRRKFGIAIGLTLATNQSATNWQINKRTLGSATNPLWSVLTSTTAGYPGFAVEQIRVLAIHVQFDNRGLPSGATGSTAFAANPRVAAMIVPFTEAEIDLKPDDIQDFGGMAVPQGAMKTIRLPVGPEFDIGRFGINTTNDTRLLIFQQGFCGVVRAVIWYEVCGFPNITLSLLRDEAVLEATGPWNPTEPGQLGCSTECSGLAPYRSAPSREPSTRENGTRDQATQCSGGPMIRAQHLVPCSPSNAGMART
jgi:hypothetical protein